MSDLRHPRWQSRRVRWRIVRRRLALWRNLAYDSLRWSKDGIAWYDRLGGRWAKWNGVCSCGMCRGEKYRDRRASDRQRERRAQAGVWD